MNRYLTDPRENWQAKVEQWGLLYHDNRDEHEPANLDYWDESVYYQFSPGEVDALEAATNELHEMCMAAVAHVITKKRYKELSLAEEAIPWIERSWSTLAPSIYGRLDLAYDGVNPPKMLEYNADTPVALLEAAVVQWKWLEDRSPESDQFNSIWEDLVATWKRLKASGALPGPLIHFAHLDNIEESMTAAVLQDTAHEAGLRTEALLMQDIGWDSRRRVFVDLANRQIQTIFKLYPWEWLLEDKFAIQLLDSFDRTVWIEPVWKMILSNKGILPILWELYPGHRYLLPAYFDGPRDMAAYVKKPILGREGGNISIVSSDSVETGLDFGYGSEGYIFQQFYELPCLEGMYPVIGSWVVDGVSRGIGIRESAKRITDNLSSFVPHLFC